MTPIPPKLCKEMALDPYYATCSRYELFHDHECLPDPLTRRLIEWEHAFIHAGRQIQEKWAIIPLCWWAHRGPGLNKEINELIALLRATTEDLVKYPRTNWGKRCAYLRDKYVFNAGIISSL